MTTADQRYEYGGKIYFQYPSTRYHETADKKFWDCFTRFLSGTL